MQQVLLILLLVLTALDAHSTWLCLARKRGTEANPVLAWLIDQLGTVAGLLAYKAPLAVLLWQGFAGRTEPEALAALVVLCVLYAVVVANNYRIASGQPSWWR